MRQGWRRAVPELDLVLLVGLEVDRAADARVHSGLGQRQRPDRLECVLAEVRRRECGFLVPCAVQTCRSPTRAASCSRCTALGLQEAEGERGHHQERVTSPNVRTAHRA